MKDYEVSKLLEEAYLYAYPLVLLDLIKDMVTNTEQVTDTKAPLGQLFHAKTLATPKMTSLTRPNVDTVYSQAYIDLGNEPYLLYKPKTDRYCSIQLFDGYSRTPEILGTGALGGSKEHTYAFVGPFYTGSLPNGVIRVNVPTDFLWLLIRTKCFGKDDLPQVHAVQEKLNLFPLAAYGEEYAPPKGVYKKEHDFIALQKIAQMPLQEFFERFNKLAEHNPGLEEDKPALTRFKALGIGAGEIFCLDVFSPAVRAQGETLNQLLDPEFSSKYAEVAMENGWLSMSGNVGTFGTNYAFRAIVAFGGFANPVSMAVYPSMSHDANGQLLRGSKNYKLHFESGMLPPHKKGGWWSLTAYDAPGHVIDNPLDRYNISEQSSFKQNSDGSLDIYIRPAHPGADREANWLPICPEVFALTMRIYLPEETVLTGEWKMPVLISDES